MGYAIAILRSVYQPDIQGAGSVRWVMDDDGQSIRIYDSVYDARAARDDLDSDVYVCQHGEAGRPEYIVLDQDVAEYVDSGRDGDGSNYDWDDVECCRNDGHACGECDTCLSAIRDQDRSYVRSMGL